MCGGGLHECWITQRGLLVRCEWVSGDPQNFKESVLVRFCFFMYKRNWGLVFVSINKRFQSPF
jgi:hypothetical protein